jgi:hypothetical protein
VLAHDQEAAHLNGAQSSRSTQKLEEGHHKIIKKVKIIYNDVLKSTNNDACIKRKIMLPEDDPVRSKHVVYIF